MNIVLVNSNLYKERYEALSLDQGFESMRSNKILRKRNCVESEDRC